MNREVTIICIEDDEDHALLVRRSLRTAGYNNEVLVFSNGEEALALLEAKTASASSPDESFCILLDLDLPGLSGIEVLARLKSNELLRKIPVIILTTLNEPATVASCHRLGASHFISKPIDTESFQKVIAQLGYFIKLVELPLPFKKR